MTMLEKWDNVGISESMKYEIENESGKFCCDGAGRLTYFSLTTFGCSSRENVLYDGPHGFSGFGNKRCMKRLNIPEGIREIGCDAENLWDMVVIEKIVLPKTLEKLGAGVLSGCLIMEMELPASLREIGAGALMRNYIHVLRISQDLPHPQYPSWDQYEARDKLNVIGRQFKETIVNTLIVPKGYPYKMLMPEAKIKHVVFLEE